MSEDLVEGDIITIDNVPEVNYPDGRKRKWRVAETVDRENGIRATRLIPLNDNGTVNEFNAAAGAFFITGPKDVARCSVK